MRGGGKIHIDYDSFKVWALDAPVINLDPSKDPSSNFYLTFLYVEQPMRNLSNLLLDREVVVEVLGGVFGDGETEKKGKKVWVECELVDLERMALPEEDLGQRQWTELEYAPCPVWNEEMSFSLQVFIYIYIYIYI